MVYIMLLAKSEKIVNVETQKDRKVRKRSRGMFPVSVGSLPEGHCSFPRPPEKRFT